MKSIAIDGPAGAGKSTLARRLAGRLGFLYVDTGAIYRTVALKALRAGADPGDPSQVVPLLAGLDIGMDYSPEGEQRMFLEGEDVSQAIREHQVSGITSKVSAIPKVRAFLLDVQRRLAEEQAGLPPEGRAILSALGDTLGRYEAPRQREALSAARRRLEELAVRLEADSRRQGRVYQALGLSGGAFLVILLL